MCITEYNEIETMNLFKEEGRAEGRAEAVTDFRKKTSELLSQGHTADEILKELGMFSQ